MSTLWNWFAKTDEAPLHASADDEDTYSLASADTLPRHVEEFLAMKSAADL